MLNEIDWMQWWNENYPPGTKLKCLNCPNEVRPGQPPPNGDAFCSTICRLDHERRIADQ